MAEEARLRQYLEKVTVDLRKAHRRVRDLELSAQEPIAIIGMGCRFPGGVGSPQELWDLVASGVDGISDFPADRGWDLERLYDSDPDRVGTSYVREGGFVDNAGAFDPGFFGIGPREALVIDPQQRLLLEVCWEALEHAGFDPQALRGTKAGVFAGAMYHDYGWGVAAESPGSGGYGPTVGTGGAISGRVAYTLGLEGPALTVDTACSSSLVAMHLAARALRSGECSLALAGGVTVFSTPRGFIEFSRQRALAPDGRCKSFAEAADGVGFAEGVGVLALERLSEAEENGHPVLATIRGSAVNQDGASNGFTAPNGPSQERVIRQALLAAGLAPGDVDAVEAHGTGTILGDPIEAGALLATYGQERDRPLKLGSIKSNIGHAQAAAGVAGVIKTVMAMREGALPRTLHLDAPSSNVDWEAGEVELLAEAEPWQPNGRPRRAGVSSFGATGTNAHVILEEAPVREAAAPRADSGDDCGEGADFAEAPLPGPVPLALSAKTEDALRESSARLRSHLEANPGLDPRDVAYSLITTRPTLEHRAVVTGSDRQQLLAGLDALERGSASERVVEGRARTTAEVAFLFPGQGSQWQGMGLELDERSPVFAHWLDECEAALSPHIDFAVRDVLAGVDGAPSIERIEIVQPVLFAVMVSLAELWKACGVIPTAVAGHSQGEIAAAHAAGGLSLGDAAMLAALRSRLISRLAEDGGMVSVALGADRLPELIGRWGDRIEVAARNGPSSTIVSGDREALDGLLERCAADGVRARIVPAAIASHSAYVEVLRDELLELLAPIEPRSGDIPFYSTVTGGLLDTRELGPGYWYRNLREPVRFEQVTRELLRRGQRTLIEVSPHPVFALAMAETVEDEMADPGEATVLGSLRRDEGGVERFALSLSRAHASGARLDWSAFFAGGARRVPLPTYPFQRKRYWLNPVAAGGGDVTAAGQSSPDHPLLGAAIGLAGGEEWLLTGRISLQTHPWLADHAVTGTVLLPGTAFVELAIRAGSEVGCEALEELTLEAPLVLTAEGGMQVQLAVGRADERGRREIAIYSRPQGDEQIGGAAEWNRNARGFLSPEPAETTLAAPQSWPPDGAEPLEVEGLYERLADLGFEYGPAFQGVKAAWRKGDDLFTEVSLPEEQAREAQQFGVHPALLDSTAHAGLDLAIAGALGQDGEQASGPVLPFAWRDVRFSSSGATSVRVRAGMGGGGMVAFDQSGAEVFSVASVDVRPVDPGQLQAAARSRSLYRLGWEPVPPATTPPPESVAILAAGPVEGIEAERHPDLGALLAASEDGAALPALAIADFRPGRWAESLPGAAHAATAEALELLQAWLAEERLEGSRLLLLTEGALAAAEEEGPDLTSAPICGLLRSAQSEHPGHFQLLDTDGSEASRQALAQALATVEEPQLALREGKLLAPRLARAQVQGPEPAPAPIDPESTVLITGGTSGMGALFARHLVASHGARNLLLASRRGGEAPGAPELLAELEELGASVTVAACDVSEREQLRELLAQIPPEHPLGAVIHSAAVLDDGVLDSLDRERLQKAFAPKADAAWHLHELTAGLELSDFVVFSSVAGLLGNPAQANYAAANAFLDALAAHRHARGLPALALAWGGWGEGSLMIADLREADRARLGRMGFAAMSSAQVLELFDAARDSGETLLAPVELNPAALRARARAGTLPQALRGIVPVPSGRAAETGSLAARLSSLPEAEREAAVLDLVREHAAAVLGHASAADVDPERAFQELGFDSLGAVELRNRLGAATGLRLAPTLVFDYPTAAALAKFLREEAEGRGQGTAATPMAARSSEEPIAIVGMSCRFPGAADSPQELWRLLAQGGDGIEELPTDRGWNLERLYDPDPDVPGTSYARHGGFVDDVAGFDPGFFGIAPREALATDPQQRLLLEASWRALEGAGIDPASLRGSPTSVFAGAMYNDYGNSVEGVAPGMTSSIISGRVAYSLGLEGTAMTLDTACSSSLVALHLAAGALRGGECSLALAGGVTVLSTPNAFAFFSRQRALAPDGHSKPFAEAADGIGLSEGVGLLVLERLSDAQRNDHTVLATIRGSAVNQDGASNGLTAPNGPSQERVIRQALANARLSPQDIDAVEAHGTGTTLGDPIEAGALLATYGQDRDRPLKLGSIKSNIGHTQAAAGVAGVIKTVMAMQAGLLPKTLHIDEPSSKVDWEAGEIELLTEAVPWPANGRPRRAGVSSFGISGTNAHLILEQAPEPEEAGKGEGDAPGGEPAPTPLPGPLALLLSAKTEPALQAQASRLAAHLRSNPGLDPTDVAFSLATTRACFEQRAVALGTDREQLLEGLDALGRGEQAARVARGRAGAAQSPAFLFGGQGSQHPAMALELLERSPAFAANIEECEAALDPYVEWSLREALREQSGAWMERLDIVQPALFAVMVSLARLWQQIGVSPAVVIGHSQGEIAAAHIAGGLSLKDAARVVALRAKAMTKLAGKGAMLSLSLSPPEGEALLAPFGRRLSLAAINGPASLVVSGEPKALAELQAGCEKDGVRTQKIAVDYAAHSTQIEDLEEELLEAFAPVSPRSGEIPLHSTVTGELLDTAQMGAEYWYRNLRQSVLFEPVVRSQLQQGRSAFVEISPHPVLGFGVQEAIDALPKAAGATVLETLRRDQGGPERFALSLAQAHTDGIEVEWATFFEGTGAEQVPLPTYPFQRRRYWLNASSPADAGSIGQADPEHPLLGSAIEDPTGEGLTMTGRLSLATHPWLADHAVTGTVLLPGTALLELALRAGQQVECGTLEELTLAAPLVLPEHGAVHIQVLVSGPGERGTREISIHSRTEADPEEGTGEWALHARGALVAEGGEVAEALGAWPPEGAEPLDPELLDEPLVEAGFEYGPAFQGLEAAWQHGEDVYAEISLRAEQAPEAERFSLHPALLEPASRALAWGASLAGDAGSGTAALPVTWRGVRLRSAGAPVLRVRITAGAEQPGLVVFDQAGAAVISIDSVALAAFDPGPLRSGRRSLYRIEWEAPAPRSSNGSAPSFAVLGEAGIAGIEADRHADLPALLEAISSGGDGPDAVLVDFRGAGEGKDLPQAPHDAARRALDLAQAWVAAEPGAGMRLVFLTEEAIAVTDGDEPDLATSPLPGLLRSAQSEHPGAFALVDIDRAESSPRSLALALATGADEPQLAIREGELLAPRLARVEADAGEAPGAPPVDPDSTVLICGDHDGLGALAARRLVSEHGARRLLLVEGGEATGGMAGLRAELEDLGAEVRVEAGDLGDRGRLEELLGSLTPEHPLGAVVLSAAVLDDGMLGSLDPERLERTMRPKVDAAWHLHELTAGIELSQFLLFSSAASLLGGAAQANYSAANAFLDALAAHRRAGGLPATSLAWGLQAGPAGPGDAGDRVEAMVVADRIQARLGLAPMPAEQALDLLGAAGTRSESLLAPVELDLKVLRAQAKAGTLPAILRRLVRVPSGAERATGSLTAAVAGLPELERGAAVLEAVRGHAAAVLGYDSHAEIEPERAFQDLGFDSLGAVELRNRLAAATGLSLPTTLAFDYPSAATLAEFLSVEMEGGQREVAVVSPAAASTEEPIAIIGMSCRYPGGASSPELLWQLLAEERDAIAELPADRGWDFESLRGPDPDHPEIGQVRAGGYLDDVADFDPVFFGIAPREAVTIDPQQRLMLEASWEALEDAGIDPDSLRGSSAGVFVGAGAGDYGWLLGQNGSAAAGSLLTGASPSVLAGRVSYTLGLEGPAVAVDTACSSSLVALHLASQALRSGECSTALAGGVIVMSTPAALIDLSRLGGLASDGRCKAFADAADGTGFSEGVGVLMLERLSEARRRGHPVLATIRGSAINQDGASNGLTAPSGPSQERVIRQALANAGLEPGDVDAVEAHGTGTVLGDPIEAGAVLATYGQERERPLWLGSIKSNIGHTGAAAGVAGVIKMVMAMRAGVLPRTLHVDRPSTRIDWSAGQVDLLTESVAWGANGSPRRAGVSSFGMSGTNAHLIVEEAAGVGERETPPETAAGEAGAALPGVPPLLLSAKTETALRATAERLRSHLERNDELDLTDVAYSLATTRSSFARRAAVLGEDREALLDTLAALGRGSEDSRLVLGDARPSRKPAFLFSGYGSLWPGMALELLDSSPVFSRSMQECIEALDPYLDWSVEQVLRGAEGAPALERSDVGSLVLFATSVSLARLWLSCGVQPAAVAGHSQGELVAAHIAGGLTLEDAARVAALRNRALLKLEGKGAIASIALPAAQVEPRLRAWGGAVGIAAINGPGATVVSGECEPLDELLAQCAADGVQAKKIPGAFAASHSAQVDALRDELLEQLAPISPRSGTIPFYSTVTGAAHDTARLDAEYWFLNARQAVLLEPVARRLIEIGCHTLIEVSPHPVLGIGLRETAETLGDPGSVAVLGTLRRDEGGPRRFARSLAEAHVAGAEIDWQTYFEGAGAGRVRLPTYAFQRKRYWLDVPPPAGDVSATGMGDAEHPLLAAGTQTPAGDWLFSGRIAIASHPWLADHTAFGEVRLPASAFVELALSVAGRVGAAGVQELTLQAPLVVAEDGAVQVQASVGARDQNGEWALAVHSRPIAGDAGDESEWACHATGTLSARAPEPDPGAAELAATTWPPPGAEPVEVELLHDALGDRGLDYGPALRGLRAAWRRDGELFAEAFSPEESAGGASPFDIDPALLDCVAHAGVDPSLLEAGVEGGGDLLQPYAWKRIGLHRPGATALRLRVGQGPDGAGLSAVDADGAPVLSVGAVLGRVLEPSTEQAAWHLKSLYRVEWPELQRGAAADAVPGVVTLGEVQAPGFDAERYDDIPSLLAAVEGGGGPRVVVADLSSEGGEDRGALPEAVHATCRRALELLQSWVASDGLEGVRLTVLTRGALALAEGELPDLGTAPLWGMLRSAQTEHPGRFALVDVDGSEASWKALPRALAAGAEEPQLAVREGGLLTPRLARAELEKEAVAARPIDPDTTVLITGGAGGIGAVVARHLASRHGIRHLLLAGRRGGRADGAAELERELSDLGAELTIAACDVADREQLKALLDSIPGEHPLGAVIHSAAVLDNGVLESLDAERLERVLRPKVDAAWHLHELTEESDLSQFLLFSSAAGILGNAAQVNYAAGNVFLDTLAAHRRALGLPATSLAWGGWVQESNLFDELSEADRARVDRLGIVPMLPEQALELFDLARAGGEAQLAPFGLNRAGMRAQARKGLLPPVLRNLIQVSGRSDQPGAGFRARLAAAPAGGREAIFLDLVREQAAAVLGYPSGADLGAERALQEMGLDSLGAVELRNHLAAATGLPVPMLALTNHPTPAGIAKYLSTQPGPSEAGGNATPSSLGSDSTTAFVELLGKACEEQRLAEFVEVLAVASNFRETFDGPGTVEKLPQPVRLAEGAGSSSLVLLSSVGPGSGPHEYVKFAKAFDRSRDVYALPLPGFVAGEPLPDSVRALVEVYAEVLSQLDLGPDYVLAGHSSGGWVAHALAGHLESIGVQPAAVVLLDTFLPQSPTLREILPSVLESAHTGGVADDARLTALGGYSRIFSSWEPAELVAPTLMVRPAQGVESGDEAAASWEKQHTKIEVPGNHFTMVNEQAVTTALAVRDVIDVY